MSKNELKDAIADTNRILSEIVADRIRAISAGDYELAARLLELYLSYMNDKNDYQRKLVIYRRKRNVQSF